MDANGSVLVPVPVVGAGSEFDSKPPTGFRFRSRNLQYVPVSVPEPTWRRKGNYSGSTFTSKFRWQQSPSTWCQWPHGASFSTKLEECAFLRQRKGVELTSFPASLSSSSANRGGYQGMLEGGFDGFFGEGFKIFVGVGLQVRPLMVEVILRERSGEKM